MSDFFSQISSMLNASPSSTMRDKEQTQLMSSNTQERMSSRVSSTSATHHQSGMQTNVAEHFVQPPKTNYQKLQRDNFMPQSNSFSLDAQVTCYNYMPGTASLIGDIDKQLMVILRDGRSLIGYLRSIDQFANLLLSNTIERIHVGTKYGDIPRGIYMIRGENVVLLGEVDFSLPLKVNMTKVDIDEILELQRIEKKKQEEAEKIKKKSLLERCLVPHTDAILDEYY
jgi:U6 snRNA-associated Sm-like protein LSm1